MNWQEYDDAARWCAVRGIKGVDGDRLPELLSAEVYAEICQNPEEFRERIRLTAYALAQSKLKPYRISFTVEGKRHKWIRFYNNMEAGFSDAKELALKEYPTAHGFMIESNQSETSEIPEYWKEQAR